MMCFQCDSDPCRCIVVRVIEKTEKDREFFADAVARGALSPAAAEHAMKPVFVTKPPTDKLTPEQFADEFAKFLDEG